MKNESYKKHVEKNLRTVTEILANISLGDYSGRIDVESLPENEFMNVYCGLDLLMGDLQEARQELEEQNKINALRISIWEIAVDRSLNARELWEKLLSITGSFFSVHRASYYVFDEARNCAECSIQWCSEKIEPTIGDTLPLALCKSLLLSEHVVLTTESVPAQVQEDVLSLFQHYDIKSFLAVPYATLWDPRGFVTFSSREQRQWTEKEKSILSEIVRIVSTKVAQIHAEEELRRANERLERNVLERTAELNVVNERLTRDISERKRMEKTIREREKFLANIFSSIQDGISILDTDLTIIRVNPTIEQWYPHEMPLVGKRCYQAYHGRTMPCDICPTREALDTGTTSYGAVKKIDGNGRQTGWLDLYSYPLVNQETGELTGVIEYVRDISDRKRTEEELAEEKKLLDVTLRSIGDGVISTDMNGRVMLINEVAERLTGFGEEDALGVHIDEVLRLGDEKQRDKSSPVRRILTAEKRIEFETAFTVTSRRDARERAIEISGSPIRDLDGKLMGAVLVLRDISDRQRLEDELFKARKLESLGVLAGGIAHDFNNILTGIVTNLFMVKMSVKDNEVVSLVVDAEKAAYRASKLTKQLLTFSKGGAPVKENVSIQEIIEESVGFCLSGSNVNYSLEFPDDLWAVRVDRGQIDQVMNNLVMNADQAMPEGGRLTVQAENVEVSEEVTDDTAYTLPLKPGKYVKVSVRDEGVGIAPKNLSTIFDPYFTTKQDGSGLGLTTSYSIIRKHGGHITVRSRLGRGSTFVFYLPASVLEPDDLPESPDKLPKASGSILVMDDDEIVRKVVSKLLTNIGYSVATVADGEEALRSYRDSYTNGRSFDVVIMDLTIPGGMGGKDAVKKLRAFDPDARVIVFSGYSNDPILAKYQEYGFNGVIAKPFCINEFHQVVGDIFNERNGGGD